MDKEFYINELEGFVAQIHKIISLFDETNQVVPDISVPIAQELLKALKEKLGNEYKKRSTVKSGKTMTEVEKRHFFPAVHQTYAYLKIRSNSKPSEKWVMELKRAEQEINYHLNELKKGS